MKLLVNDYELITHEKLSRVCESEGARVCPKVRVKDALSLDRSGISDEQFRYGLTSHFDFVVVNAEWNTLFAVEFDGLSHRSHDAARRDRLKNDLCARFNLPLLRVNANHLTAKFRQWDLLTYFTETWFLARAFERGQQAGDIPPDVDFDPMLIFADEKGRRFPYWFSAPAQVGIQNLHKNGQIVHSAPSHIAGCDSQQNIRYLAWIKIAEGAWAMIRSAMRNQQFDVCTSDVLEQIEMIELHQQLSDVLAGKVKPHTDHQINAVTKRWRKSLDVSSSGGYCTMSQKELFGD